MIPIPNKEVFQEWLKAFEAMREALRGLVREIRDGFTESEMDAFSGLLQDEYENARAALALADKVRK